MASTEHPGAEPEPSSAEQRQERLDALSTLAHQRAADPPPAPMRRPRTRLVAGIALGALALVIIAGGALRFALAPRATTTTPPHPQAAAVTIAPRENRLRCPVDVAWSPDGTRVAVLGYATCEGAPFAATNPGIVNIYDTTTGQLMWQFFPDPLVLRNPAVSLTPPSPPISRDDNPAPPFIRYQALLWTLNGARLLLPFFVENYKITDAPPFILGFGGTQLPAHPITTVAGVLMSDPLGNTPQVITAPYQQNSARMEWDLKSGKLLSGDLTLAPALSYVWNHTSQLQPQTPLSATGGPPPAPAPGPVGLPNGDIAFTIWQPGEAAPAYTFDDNGATAAPGIALWYSRFAALSPDERYLITPGYTGGRVVWLDQPAPSAAVLAATGNTNMPLLSPRDPTLRKLYARMGPTANGEPPAAQFVAWRPDGRVVASTAEPYFGAVAAHNLLTTTAVTLYDAASGRELATLKPQTRLDLALTSPLTLRFLWLNWSPDGTRLLLLDNAIGTLTIWGPGTLPT